MRRFALRVFRWWCAMLAQWFRHVETDPSRLPVSRLKNITPRLSKLLGEIDVKTRADLVRLGSLEVYRVLLEQGNPPNQDVLLALHGAITNQVAEQISLKEKAYLLKEAADLEPQKTW
jgi:hypothetical protein